MIRTQKFVSKFGLNDNSIRFSFSFFFFDKLKMANEEMGFSLDLLPTFVDIYSGIVI